ncbi:hypothetical protein VNO77_04899 [Canavalia gladiata]|uniref:Uncharacterized protein n=1 Tax=Canavalia gladiata TaxID=3824 RepID=A0AAN9RDP0_CANGL
MGLGGLPVMPNGPCQDEFYGTGGGWASVWVVELNSNIAVQAVGAVEGDEGVQILVWNHAACSLALIVLGGPTEEGVFVFGMYRGTLAITHSKCYHHSGPFVICSE